MGQATSIASVCNDGYTVSMHWIEHLKTNRTARHAFLLLLGSFLLIFVVGNYILSSYMLRHHQYADRRNFGVELRHTIRLLNLLPQDFSQRHNKLFLGKGIHTIKFVDGPAANAQVLQHMKPKEIDSFARRNFFNFKVYYQLNSRQWVFIQGGGHRNPYLWVGFLLSAVFLLLLLIVICVRTVQWLVIPVADFTKASKRFGVDLQAPPMPVQGAPQMQELSLAFNEMQSRIRRLINDRTQMLAAISHDLRTPITRLQLRIEALNDPKQYAAAEADLNEMERMISSILSFARDYVRTEAMEKFDVIALTENICNELEDTGMNVSCKSDLTRFVYFGRMLAIKRALTNLIENAVKYGNRAEVLIEQESAAGLKIKIRDYGDGIPAAEMEKVFAPFYRLDPARNPEKSGSGLGLAVARDIVRAHGGDIKLLNHDDGGLLVVVFLPLERRPS